MEFVCEMVPLGSKVSVLDKGVEQRTHSRDDLTKFRTYILNGARTLLKGKSTLREPSNLFIAISATRQQDLQTRDDFDQVVRLARHLPMVARSWPIG